LTRSDLDDRPLALHAELLAFTHPHTHRRIELVRPAPF
jgi:23S rRNA-/tRNA-specific pseudouridylate synthase